MFQPAPLLRHNLPLSFCSLNSISTSPALFSSFSSISSSSSLSPSSFSPHNFSLLKTSFVQSKGSFFPSPLLFKETFTTNQLNTTRVFLRASLQKKKSCFTQSQKTKNEKEGGERIHAEEEMGNSARREDRRSEKAGLVSTGGDVGGGWQVREVNLSLSPLSFFTPPHKNNPSSPKTTTSPPHQGIPPFPMVERNGKISFNGIRGVSEKERARPDQRHLTVGPWCEPTLPTKLNSIRSRTIPLPSQLEENQVLEEEEEEVPRL